MAGTKNEQRQTVRAQTAERGEGGLDDEWQHEQLVDVERKADGGDGADEPLSAAQAEWSGCHASLFYTVQFLSKS